MEASLGADWILPVLTILLGASMGSFAAFLADALPRGRPVVFARSSCRSCGQILRWYEMVPILSFLALRGRCARCGASIPVRLLQAELAGLAIGVLAVWAGVGFIGAMVLWCLLALILSDLLHYRLPNALTLGLLLLALTFVVVPRGVGSPNMAPLWQAVLGAAVGAGIFYAISWLYLVLRGRIGMGAGDIHLMGGIGALVVPVSGWVGLGMVTLIAGLTGLLLGVSRAIRRGRSLSAKTPVPFGACLGMAAALVWIAAVLRPDLFAMP
ncbi:MAG: prepilin peptidase [Pseudomonadota bacterium]